MARGGEVSIPGVSGGGGTGAHALPDLISRIRVDSSGVDAAMLSLVKSFKMADLALAGVAAGIGILIVGGKSMIDIAEKHADAELSLAQAVNGYNASLKATAPSTAASADAIAKLSDIAGQAHDSLTIATNGTKLAQLAYTDAVKKHGVHSEAAYIASIHLQDATIHLRQAQEAAKDATIQLAAAQAIIPGKIAGASISLVQYQSRIDDFIKTNRRYISDQSEVINGYATLTRSGLSVTEVQRVMNDAVDLAAIKHISLNDAVSLLNAAEHGRMKGLIDLGVTTSKYTDANGNLIVSQHSVANAMDELDVKLKGGRQTLSDLQQHSNELSGDWQDLSNKGGPVLLIMLDKVVTAVTAIYDEFDKIGHDDQMWGAISDRLVKMASWIHQYILGPLGQVGEYISGAPLGQDLAPGSAVNIHGGSASTGARQYGGPMIPGGIYTVGERGPETVVMGARGGMVIPNGGSGGGDTFNFHQVQTDPWEVANQIAWTKKTRRL